MRVIKWKKGPDWAPPRFAPLLHNAHRLSTGSPLDDLARAFVESDPSFTETRKGGLALGTFGRDGRFPFFVADVKGKEDVEKIARALEHGSSVPSVLATARSSGF